MDRGEEFWGMPPEQGTTMTEEPVVDRSGNRGDYKSSDQRGTPSAAGTENTLRGQASGASSIPSTDDSIRGQASGAPTYNGGKGGQQGQKTSE